MNAEHANSIRRMYSAHQSHLLLYGPELYRDGSRSAQTAQVNCRHDRRYFAVAVGVLATRKMPHYPPSRLTWPSARNCNNEDEELQP